jgi:hypothetical protein
MARFNTLARLCGLALVALQGALAAKAPIITHQSPENAPPISYLNLVALFTTLQGISHDSSKESSLLPNLFDKRLRSCQY